MLKRPGELSIKESKVYNNSKHIGDVLDGKYVIITDSKGWNNFLVAYELIIKRDPRYKPLYDKLELLSILVDEKKNDRKFKYKTIEDKTIFLRKFLGALESQGYDELNLGDSRNGVKLFIGGEDKSAKIILRKLRNDVNINNTSINPVTNFDDNVHYLLEYGHGGTIISPFKKSLSIAKISQGPARDSSVFIDIQSKLLELKGIKRGAGDELSLTVPTILDRENAIKFVYTVLIRNISLSVAGAGSATAAG